MSLLPGKNHFRRRYLRYQRGKPSLFRKLVSIVGGLLFVAAGFVMLVAPGPGVVCLLLGVAMLAQNSLIASTHMDRLIPRLISIGSSARSLWKNASPMRKALLAGLAFISALVPPYLAYELFS